MAELHNRMPVILEQQDWPTWLGETEGDSTELIRPAPDGLLRTWPVDRRVGSPRNNGRSCWSRSQNRCRRATLEAAIKVLLIGT